MSTTERDAQRRDGPTTRAASDVASVRSYERLLERFAVVAAVADVPVRTRDPGPLHFSMLDPSMRDRVLTSFGLYVEVCEEAAAEGRDHVVDDVKLFWRMLTKRRLRPKSDVLTLFADGDLIEIYDCSDWVQVFRTFSFFKVCSYTLDDILCRPWYDLYERDAGATAKIRESSLAILDRKAPDPYDYDLPPHVLEERDSSNRYRFLIESRFLSRLYDRSGRIEALVNVARVVRRL